MCSLISSVREMVPQVLSHFICEGDGASGGLSFRLTLILTAGSSRRN